MTSLIRLCFAVGIVVGRASNNLLIWKKWATFESKLYNHFSFTLITKYRFSLIHPYLYQFSTQVSLWKLKEGKKSWSSFLREKRKHPYHFCLNYPWSSPSGKCCCPSKAWCVPLAQPTTADACDWYIAKETTASTLLPRLFVILSRLAPHLYRSQIMYDYISCILSQLTFFIVMNQPLLIL